MPPRHPSPHDLWQASHFAPRNRLTKNLRGGGGNGGAMPPTSPIPTCLPSGKSFCLPQPPH